jgi:Protein of unknown function (DUF1194)
MIRTGSAAVFRRIFGGAVALLFAAAFAAPARTQTQVDLQLVLAVDASGSVSQDRFDLQKQGYAAAFRHPRVLQAVLSGLNQSIAVTMVQWTGPALQVVAVKWALIKDAGSIRAFADAIEQAPRQLFGGGTSISGAIDTGVALLNDSPYKAVRRIIDISGDGPNNRGRSVTQARDEAVAAKIGINGLPILSLDPTLDKYYEENVIGGPGAFVVPAKDYETFAESILKKLITEIAGTAPGKMSRR